jgi:hypothetical protein
MVLVPSPLGPDDTLIQGPCYAEVEISARHSGGVWGIAFIHFFWACVLCQVYEYRIEGAAFGATSVVTHKCDE